MTRSRVAFTARRPADPRPRNDDCYHCGDGLTGRDEHDADDGGAGGGRAVETRGRAPRLHRAGREFLSVLDALCIGTRVIDHRDFAPALEHVLALKRPALIEVVTDPNQVAVGTTIAELRAPFGRGED